MSRPSTTSPPSKPLPEVVDKENELGTLIVVLLKARNLNDKHSFRKQDVFAQATLNGATKQTAVDIKGGQHPEWDGEVRFSIKKNTGSKFRTLEVACYAKEPRSDDLLGKGTVDITETLKTGEFDDWVPLDIDGVQRGDIYLEMTYYANAPPPASVAVAAPSPNKFLSAVKNQDGHLMRRPSKLKPSERLSRPIPTQSQYQYPAPGTSPPSQYAPSRPSGLQNNYGPPRREGSYELSSPTVGSPHSRIPSGGIPSLLQPGAADQRPGATPLPNLLRPGATPSPASPGPNSDPNPYLQGHGRTPSTSPPSVNTLNTAVAANNPYIQSPSVAVPGRYSHTPVPVSSTPVSIAPQNPYFPGSTSAPGPVHTYHTGLPPQQQSYGPTLPYGGQNAPPLLWQQGGNPPPPSNNGFHFPSPNIVSPTRESFQPVYQNVGAAVSDPGYAGPRPYGPPQGHGLNAPPYRHASSDDRIDAHLLARYQSPLPLPPGATSVPSRPAPAVPNMNVSSSGGYHQHQQTLPPAPPASPPKAPTPAPGRLDALKRAEGEAARRREQELKDLELALQLDRELNMQESAAANRASPADNIPGYWR